MADVDGNVDVAALAERLVELRDEKRYVEGEIESVSAKLAAALGEGTKTRAGSYEVAVRVARPSMRVIREVDVPASFLTPKPDRKRLMDHIQSTGEVPPGIELSEGRPVVVAKAL